MNKKKREISASNLQEGRLTAAEVASAPVCDGDLTVGRERFYNCEDDTGCFVAFVKGIYRGISYKIF